MNDTRPRLIEVALPVREISAESVRDKSLRHGHISTLHLWWARRPLAACRAAVYGALVPAERFRPKNGPEEKRDSLMRANAAKFVERLCKYPGNPSVIKEAQRHILEAHAERLTREIGEKVTVEDIEEGGAPRPKVLDMFAGGGAIPLEALRLGCEAYALDLNPVAHIIELCTLVYPQKYGNPDPNARGMTGLPAPRRYWVYVIKCSDHSFYIGQTDNLLRRYEDHLKGKVEWTADRKPLELVHWEVFDTREEAAEREKWLKTGFGRKWIKREYEAGRLAEREAGPKNDKGLPASLEGLAQPGETNWGGLAEEVRYWGNWVLERVKAEIGDLYPLIPDPEYKGRRPESQAMLWKSSKKEDVPPGYLVPVAYLWTRTVRCKNPSCGATVPLVKQTWLCKKKGGKKSSGRFVALKVIAPKGEKKVRFEVVEATTQADLGFDPSIGSKGGNATCPFCGTVADIGYVKDEGWNGRMGQQLMAIVCTRPGTRGKVYLSADDYRESISDDDAIQRRIKTLCKRTGLTVPSEPIANLPDDCRDNTLGITVRPYGLRKWGDLFTPRQMLCLLTFAAAVREAQEEMRQAGVDAERAKAVGTCLCLPLNKLADLNCSLTTWKLDAELCVHAFGRQALPMVWDFAEEVPYSGIGGSWQSQLERTIVGWNDVWPVEIPATVTRGSATSVPWPDASFDAVITAPLL